MKILILSHEYPPVGGGGANACRELANVFAQRGNEVHVITVGSDADLDEQVAAGGRLHLYFVPAARKSLSYSTFFEMLDYNRRARKLAYELVRGERPDVCLAFFGIPGGAVAYRLWKRCSVPYVIRLGGGDIPGFQDRFQILYRLLSGFLRRIWRDASVLVANSEGLRKTARAFCDWYEIKVIPNGVDSSAFSPEDVTEENGSKVFPLTNMGSGKEWPEEETVRLLAVTRLIPRKRLQDVIPHLKEWEAVCGKKVRLTIAGDGPYREALEQLAAESGTSDRIVFLGQIDKAELPEIYRKHDIFLCPSDKEGMPNAVLEAMASGLPVIMRKSCQGSLELVTDNGLLAAGEYDAAVLDMLMLDAEKRREMGCRSRERAVQEFSWENTAQQYLEIFRVCIDKSCLPKALI